MTELNPTLLAVLPWVREGNCCSQILYRLLASEIGYEDPNVLLALKGLCHGIGQSGGVCGLFTGGACALALAMAHVDDKVRNQVLFDYAEWFSQTMEERFGGVSCEKIVQALGASKNSMDLMRCGELLVLCWEAMMSLLDEYQIPLGIDHG